MDEEHVLYLDDFLESVSKGFGKELSISDDENYIVDKDGKKYFKLID